LGKLSAGGGFCLFILSEFEWKSTAIEPLDDTQTPQGNQSPHLLGESVDDNQTPQDQQSPHLLGQLNLEITLIQRLPPSSRKFHAKNTMVNGGSLTDDAFQPKSFTARIEQGNFSTPAHINSSDRHWTKRLVFNTSPYPPESEWKESWRELWTMDEGNNYWDCKAFVADSPKLDKFAATHKSIGRPLPELGTT
jgi:hypothetical protein